MLIRLLLLGKTRRTEIRGMLEDYAARIRRFAELQIAELREGSPTSIRKAALAPGATVVLLDDKGKQFSSAQFANWLAQCRDGGIREIVFLCGSAEGFPDWLARTASMRMSLSPLTFSHELARVMLAEQIYRAFTILSGHPYAK